MEKDIYENLVRYYNGIEGTYDIYASIEEFPRLVRLGYCYDDRLAILKMLYLNNCSLDDLLDMSLTALIRYIEETDDCYKDDKKYFDECINEINECNC